MQREEQPFVSRRFRFDPKELSQCPMSLHSSRHLNERTGRGTYYSATDSVEPAEIIFFLTALSLTKRTLKDYRLPHEMHSAHYRQLISRSLSERLNRPLSWQPCILRTIPNWLPILYPRARS